MKALPPPSSGDNDLLQMRTALALARRGLGQVWPNPAVGCLLVGDGRIIARGWTQPGGRPHAEAEALRRAGLNAAGATAYVTLEPCAHQGVTPPCCDALIEAGVARVVVAIEDPDRRVNGQGIARLRQAGVDVAVGICQQEAAELNRGFFLRIASGRPLITLKLATSLDGRIATRSGDSKWITSDAARQAAHGLRASHDAVLVGSGTALADDPALTCRLPGMAARSPVRVVADSRLRLPLTAALVSTAATIPTWLLTAAGGEQSKIAALQSQGVVVLEVATTADGRLDPAAMAGALASRGITRVLLEGGGELAAAFLRADLVDNICWFAAPKIIGGDGTPAIAALGLQHIAGAPGFVSRFLRCLGDDVSLRFSRP